MSSVNRPPLPPPRSELESLYDMPVHPHADTSPSVELVVEGTDTRTSTNPFEALETEVVSRPKSPFEDFGSSIAEALINNSERKQSEDPVSASALASAGKELFETLQEERDYESVLESFDSQVSSSVTPVLQPSVTVSASEISEGSTPPSSVSGSTSPLFNPASAGSATSDVSTTLLRNSLHPRHRSNSLNRQQNASILRPIPQEGTFSADSIANNTNPFYSGSINAGNYPHLTPLSQKPSGPRSPCYVQNFPLPGSRRTTVDHKRTGQPPPKPQPYSGGCQWSGNDVVRTPRNSAAFMIQRLPSLGNFDPFGDFVSTNPEGMAGYVLENTNTSPR